MSNATTVAALYVIPDGVYSTMPGVDLWPESRDARVYAGPHPVVAHPPCAAWSRMASLREWKYGYKRGIDGGCFSAALSSVRNFGGVLEHPAESAAWAKFGLLKPRFGSWQRSESGDWVTEVWQVDYGHRARKRTWLLCSGTVPPPLRWEKRKHSAVVSGSTNHNSRPTCGGQRVWAKEAKRTPPEFAELLLSIARSASHG